MGNDKASVGVTISVRVTPRADRNSVLGVRAADGVLLVRTTAAPVDGAANTACQELIATLFGVRRAQVILTGGATNRDKRFVLESITAEQVQEKLASLTTH